MKCPCCSGEINEGVDLYNYGVLIPVVEFRKLVTERRNILHEVFEKTYDFDVLADVESKSVFFRVCPSCGHISMFVSKNILGSH
jgi:hypothetical protein